MNARSKIKTVLTFAFAVIAVFLAVGSASALDNTGFEVPDQGSSGYQYNPVGGTWVFTGGSGLSGPDGPWRCNSTSPDPLGDQFAYLQNSGSTISQDVTGLDVNYIYELSFFESYRTAMDGAGNDLSVILDEGLDTEIVIYNNPGVTNATWEKRTIDELIAAKTSYTLTFRTSNPLGGDRSTLIDGVVLTQTGISDPTYPDVDAGSDWATWSGADLTLSDVNVVNNSDPFADLTFAWSADPEDGVVFDSNTIEFPTITITKATSNPSVVTLTLVVNNAGSGHQDVIDTMDIEVYDDFCEAAKGIGTAVSFDSSDINRDCITDLRDFAELAALWLVDYALTGPVPKNGVSVDYDGNFKIDLADFAVLASTWGNGSDADDLADLARRWLDNYK